MKRSALSSNSAKLLVTFASIVGVAFVAGLSCQISSGIFGSTFSEDSFCGFVDNNPSWLVISAIASIGTILLIVINNMGPKLGDSRNAPNERVAEQKIGMAKEKLNQEHFSDRVEGVTELENLARKSPSRHSDVMKILMGFIKRNASIKGMKPDDPPVQQVQADQTENEEATSSDSDAIAASPDNPTKAEKNADPNPLPPALTVKPGVDVLVAIKAVANRNYHNDDQEGLVDLSHANLRGAVVPGSYLKGANLQNANLSAANLEKSVLSDAILHQAWLTGANLWNARLNRATLIQAKMDRANMEKSSADRAQFWEADMRQTRLTMASVQGAKFGEAKMMDLEANETNFTQAYLVVADLRTAKLKKAIFNKADLRGAEMTGVNAEKASFVQADLSVANLTNAELGEADLRGAQLKGTIFRNTNLRGANLCGANLSQIQVQDEILGPTSVEMRRLSPETYRGTDFNQVLFDEKTIFPNGFRPDRHGMVRKTQKKNDIY